MPVFKRSRSVRYSLVSLAVTGARAAGNFALLRHPCCAAFTPAARSVRHRRVSRPRDAGTGVALRKSHRLSLSKQSPWTDEAWFVMKGAGDTRYRCQRKICVKAVFPRHRDQEGATTATSATLLASTTLERNPYTINVNDDLASTAATVTVNHITGADHTLLQRSPVASTSIESVQEAPAARRKGKGKEPDLVVEGDMLVNTPMMVGLVYLSLLLLAAYFVQGVSMVASPWQAAWTAAGVGAGVLLADLVSGVFHWSVDNYGNGDTPVFGSVIEAFQGHHASPWTIKFRPFENNVHKICYAVLPLLALLRLVNPGPAGVAFGVTFLFGSLMSQEFHRYAHMTTPPPLAATLQSWGVIIGRREHGQHHNSPFEEKYCIVNGACNDPLDKSGAFRLMEKMIFQMNGVEPICWQLDPAIKEQAMHGRMARGPAETP